MAGKKKRKNIFNYPDDNEIDEELYQEPVQRRVPVSLVLILLFLLIICLGLLYFAYMNIPGSPEYLNPIIKDSYIETGNFSSDVLQFYPNMKFNHNSISYSIDETCEYEKEVQMLEAFKYLNEKVPSISLYQSNNNPDIEVSCSMQTKDSIEGDFFIAGEGGAKEIIQTGKYNVITKGVILLYGNPHNAVECDWPNVEIHELMHVFGFGHSLNKESLMYPYLENCNQKLDSAIITKMEELYSSENLPDLYFSKINAVKRGRYMDINMTVKNIGIIDAENVIVTLLDDGEPSENFNLGYIKFGAGIISEIKNAKLIHREPEEIKLIIDYKNQIKELDKENNIVTLKF